MKSWTRYLLYASLLCLVVALYKAHYLTMPHIHSMPFFLASIVFLLAGFLADAMSWKAILARGDCPLSTRESVVAVGLSAFAKYIPGKIWALMGRAAYASEMRSYSLGRLTSLSVTWQLIVLWVGLIFGAIGLYLAGDIMVWGWAILLMWLGIGMVIFSDAAQSVARRVYRKLFGREITIPRLSIRSTLSALPRFVVLWLLWMAGFHLLVGSLTPSGIPLAVGFGFPLTMTLGILAAFAPGGLGVREGFMVAYLALVGIPVEQATAIAVGARLWFFAGEASWFVAGLAMGRMAALRRREPG